jgi:hypothetical protein
MENKWNKPLQQTLIENNLINIQLNKKIIVKNHLAFQENQQAPQKQISSRLLYDVLFILFQNNFIIPHSEPLYEKDTRKFTHYYQHIESINAKISYLSKQGFCPNKNFIKIFFMCFHDIEFIYECLNIRGDIIFYMPNHIQKNKQCLTMALKTCPNVMKLITKQKIINNYNKQKNNKNKNNDKYKLRDISTKKCCITSCDYTNYYFDNQLSIYSSNVDSKKKKLIDSKELDNDNAYHFMYNINNEEKYYQKMCKWLNHCDDEYYYIKCDDYNEEKDHMRDSITYDWMCALTTAFYKSFHTFKRNYAKFQMQYKKENKSFSKNEENMWYNNIINFKKEMCCVHCNRHRHQKLWKQFNDFNLKISEIY